MALFITLQVEENPRVLWAHLVSEHSMILDVNLSLSVLVQHHLDEHAGPCTIRNHPIESRVYTLKKLGQVLSEDE